MKSVRRHENELAQYALSELESRDTIETCGPGSGTERMGLVAFNVDGIHGHDLSSLLNDRGIAVRAGDHCTQPLHDRLDVPGSVQASFYIYNTKAEVDELLAVIDRAAADHRAISRRTGITTVSSSTSLIRPRAPNSAVPPLRSPGER